MSSDGKTRAWSLFILSAGFLRSLSVLAIPIAGAAYSVEVVVFKDKPLCEKVAQLFCERLALNPQVSQTVEWTPTEVKGRGAKTRRCASPERPFVDLNNYAAKDLVIKTTFCIKGASGDSLSLFPADRKVVEQISWKDMAPLLATPEQFERTRGNYPPTALMVAADRSLDGPVLRTVFTVQPFVMDTTTCAARTDGVRNWR